MCEQDHIEEVETDCNDYRELLLDYRKQLEQDYHYGVSSIDKAILFLAGGSIALTVQLYISNPSDYHSLPFGWIAMCLSIILSLASHWVSNRYISQSIEEIRNRENGEEELTKPIPTKGTKLIDGFNIAVYSTFIVGMILILLIILGFDLGSSERDLVVNVYFII